MIASKAYNGRFIVCQKNLLDNSPPNTGNNINPEPITICEAFKGTVLKLSLKKGTYSTAINIAIESNIDIFRNLFSNSPLPKEMNESVLQGYAISNSPAINVKKHSVIAVG